MQGQKNFVFWFEPIIDEAFTRVTGEISSIYSKDQHDEINLLLSSDGGCVSTGFAFYDFIRHILKPRINIFGLGEVGSMGVIVFLAATGKRYATPNMRLFLHEFSHHYKEEKFGPLEVQAHVQGVEKNTRAYAHIIAKASHGKLAIKKVRDMMRLNTYLHPKELVKYGLADAIL